jgi:hypothetical protein
MLFAAGGDKKSQSEEMLDTPTLIEMSPSVAKNGAW